VDLFRLFSMISKGSRAAALACSTVTMRSGRARSYLAGSRDQYGKLNGSRPLHRARLLLRSVSPYHTHVAFLAEQLQIRLASAPHAAIAIMDPPQVLSAAADSTS
jgi:hypothetical protein